MRIRVRGSRTTVRLIYVLPFAALVVFIAALFAGWLDRDETALATIAFLAASVLVFLVLSLGEAWLGWFASFEARFDVQARTFELVDVREARAVRFEALDPSLFVLTRLIFHDQHGVPHERAALAYGRPSGSIDRGAVTDEYVFLASGGDSDIAALHARLVDR